MSIYEDKFILFPLVNSQEAEEGNQILIYPTRINDATFILLCHEMEGDASIICNMQEYHTWKYPFYMHTVLNPAI